MRDPLVYLPCSPVILCPAAKEIYGNSFYQTIQFILSLSFKSIPCDSGCLVSI